jgi:hypothetical protein
MPSVSAESGLLNSALDKFQRKMQITASIALIRAARMPLKG